MKKILINAAGSSDWIGGLYYIRNILYSFTCNETIMNNSNFIIAVDDENYNLFSTFEGKMEIIRLKKATHRYRKIQLLLLCLQKQVDAIYPYWEKPFFSKFRICEILWFADYQECHFPQFYSTIQLTERQNLIKRAVNNDSVIIFSSKDSQCDLHNNYGTSTHEYLLPFVSYIENEIQALSKAYEEEIIEKYHINGQYVCVMNQFWQHKNHKVVFEAMEHLYLNHPDCSLTFVLTGKMADYRNPEYIGDLKQILQKTLVAPHIKALGFIEREEQIAIMKNSSFVIQPSLFEGWGTVVEDAKVLDKSILLSDIPVHREQMNDKCILFDPYNSVALSELIYQETLKDHHDDVKKGIADMHLRAKEYSKGFEQLLKDLESKK